MPGFQVIRTGIGWMLSQGSVIIPSHLSCKISVEIHEVTGWRSQRGWGEKSGYVWVLCNYSIWGTIIMYCHVVINAINVPFCFYIFDDSVVYLL